VKIQPLGTFGVLPPAGLLIAAKFSLSHGVTDRIVEVTYLDSHSDALAYLGVDGKEVPGSLVSWRHVTDEEQAEWDAYGTTCADCGSPLSDLGAHGLGCAVCGDAEIEAFGAGQRVA
jgi:hypothetical protein